MKMVFKAILGLGLFVQQAIAVADDGAAGPSGDGLIVHEWGTFTSFAGSDGIHLEFRPFASVESDLPPFVTNRSDPASNVFLKRSLRSRVRMETPVTYFYTEQEREVSVRVGFPKGLLTEFYPPVREIQPAYDGRAAYGPGEPIGNSSIDWGKIHLIPSSQFLPTLADRSLRQKLTERMDAALFPDASKFPHYQHARNTDSAIIRWNHGLADAESSNPEDHFEKFLFYRGIGNFELPIDISQSSNGRVFIANRGQVAIHSAFLVQVDSGGMTMAYLPMVEQGAAVHFGLQSPTDAEGLSASVTRALIGEGLYPKEAAAMVQCWRDSWFGEAGLRVFYMVPQSLTDQLLPLQVEPKPVSTTRVLVARCELMTASSEKRVLDEVAKNAAFRAEQQRIAVEKPELELQEVGVPDSILQLGRMAEPMLDRVGRLSEDPSIDEEVDTLIQILEKRASL